MSPSCTLCEMILIMDSFDKFSSMFFRRFIYLNCALITNIPIPMRGRRGRDGSLIYNFLCNQCLSPVCQWLATGRWFSTGPPVSSTNKIDRHDIPEILLKVALNTIKQTHNPQSLWLIFFSTVVGSSGVGGIFSSHILS